MEDKKYIHEKYSFSYINLANITATRTGIISFKRNDVRSILINDGGGKFSCFIRFGNNYDFYDLEEEMMCRRIDEIIVLSEDWMMESFKEELKRVAYSLMEQLG